MEGLAILTFIVILVSIIAVVAHRYDKLQKKIQKHVDRGDIDMSIIDNGYPTPACSTRETLRKLANQ